MNKSRLIVFQLKEIIYTLIFAVLGIILIIVLYNMFKSSDDKHSQASSTITNEIETPSEENISKIENNVSTKENHSLVSNQETNISNEQAKSSYTPGIYATTLNLGEQRVNLEVTVDQHVVKDITLHNLNDTITVSYPLLEPSVEYIETELSKGTPLEKIECESNNRYTHGILVETISTMLEEASKDK